MSDSFKIFQDIAMKALTPQQREQYKIIGEELHKSVDFTTSTILDNSTPPSEEITAYIVEGLKSGLHPKDLNLVEWDHMMKVFGTNWFHTFGYTDDEILEKEDTK